MTKRCIEEVGVEVVDAVDAVDVVEVVEDLVRGQPRLRQSTFLSNASR